MNRKRWMIGLSLSGALSAAALTLADEPAGTYPHCHGTNPPAPELQEYLRTLPQGFFELGHAWKGKTLRAKENRALLERGAAGISRLQDRMFEVSASGSLFVPVFLATFDGTVSYLAPDYENLFQGTLTTGTVTEYFDEVSYGQFNVEATVHDWQIMAETSSHYTGGEEGIGPHSRTAKFIREVLDAQDPSVNFGDFDNDGPDGMPNSGDDDGYADLVIIIHDTAGSEETGDGNMFRSHRSQYQNWLGSSYSTDDDANGGGKIQVSDYNICAGVRSGSLIQGIGLFAHEIGHALGIPDLYDMIEGGGSDCLLGDSEGIGHWGLMGSGDWNTRVSPAHMSAWSKAELGWLIPGEITTDRYDWPVPSASVSATAFKLWHGGIYGPEYFLVEARTADGFDKNVAAEGVLVWHVDEARGGDPVYVNYNECYPLIDLECADQWGTDHTVDHDDLAANNNRGDAGDVFDVGDAVNATTTPGLVSYQGYPTTVAINVNSHEPLTDTYRLDLLVGVPADAVDLCIQDCTGDACAEPSTCLRTWASPSIYVDNDGDDIPDRPVPDALNLFKVRVQNLGTQSVSGASVALYYGDPGVGGLIPLDLTPIGAELFMPLMDPFSEYVAEIPVDLPVPVGSVEEYCYAAVVRHPLDPVIGDDTARNRNNIALLNAQEFWDSAPPSPLRAYSSVRSVDVVNRDVSPCSLVVSVEPPPASSIPPHWQVDINPTGFPLAPGAMQTVMVTVSSTTPVHGDSVILPLRVTCVDTGEELGGDILQWFIDNVPPPAPLAVGAVVDLTTGGDNLPLSGRVAVNVDAGVLPPDEEIKYFEIHRSVAPTFPPTTATLERKVALDADAVAPGWQFRIDAQPDSVPNWYAVVAVDRAGNKSQAAFTPLQVVVPTAPPVEVPISISPGGVRVFPNPTSAGTTVDFAMERNGLAMMEVFDLRGRRVGRVPPRTLGAGRHSFRWEGRDPAGDAVASGIYMVRLYLHGDVTTRKVALIR